MKQDAFAHTLKDHPPEKWHPLDTHLKETAQLAETFASTFQAGAWGRSAGLWHDLGKYSEGFQEYLRQSSGLEADTHRPDAIGRVDHSTSGAQHANGRGLTGRLLAMIIAGHHAGLPDSEGGDSALRSRLDRELEISEQVIGAPTELLGEKLPALPKLRASGGPHRNGFALAFFTRMVFSCLVDADFLDTEGFMNPEQSRLGSGLIELRKWRPSKFDFDENGPLDWSCDT